MADTVTRSKRSEVMSLIRSSGNRSTELKIIPIFRQHGIRGWRRKSLLFGKPDFVFPKARVAVFVDGSFWHGHPTHCRVPSSNRDYWIAKIERNKARDREVSRHLRRKGWTVIRIWDFEINNPTRQWLRRLLRALEIRTKP